MKKILVTGGYGQIGTELINELRKKVLWNEIQTNFVRDTIIDNRYIVFKKSNLQAAKIN